MSIKTEVLVLELVKRVSALEAKVNELERKQDEAQVALGRAQEPRRPVNGAR